MIKDTIAAVCIRLKLWGYLLLVTLWLGLLRIILKAKSWRNDKENGGDFPLALPATAHAHAAHDDSVANDDRTTHD